VSGSSSTEPVPAEGFGFRGSRTPVPPPPRFRRHLFQNRGGGAAGSSSGTWSGSCLAPSSAIARRLRPHRAALNRAHGSLGNDSLVVHRNCQVIALMSSSSHGSRSQWRRGVSIDLARALV
jgi:hypothetical protein